eukprot:m.14453 g.14453  ORF g.14453 m.14453 type:complete len:580 (+) comp10286_c0_seq1:132-1871(+)
MATVLKQADTLTTQTVALSFLKELNDLTPRPSNPETAQKHVSVVQPVSRSLTAALSTTSWPSFSTMENGSHAHSDGSSTSSNDLHSFLMHAVTKNGCLLEPSLDEAEPSSTPSHVRQPVNRALSTMLNPGATTVSTSHNASRNVPFAHRQPSPSPPWELSSSADLTHVFSSERAEHPASAPVDKTQFETPWRSYSAKPVPNYVSPVETRQYSPQPTRHATTYQNTTVDVIVVADQQPCRTTFDVNDSNYCVEQAVACSVGRAPGTFGLKDEIGSVALSAKVLFERKGPFLLVDFDSTASPHSHHKDSSQPPHLTYRAANHHSSVPIPFTPLDDLLLAPHETPATAPAAMERHHHFNFEESMADLYNLGNADNGSHVKVLPPTADRLAKLDAAYERELGSSSANAMLETTSLTLDLEESTGTPTSKMIRSVGQMTIEEATSVLSAIDRRLNIIGLKSQREKAAFLSSIGAKISQQHYSTLLKAVKGQRWTGGVRASYTVRKLQAAVLDPSESAWSRHRELVPHVRSQQRFQRRMSKAAKLNAEAADNATASSTSTTGPKLSRQLPHTNLASPAKSEPIPE